MRSASATTTIAVALLATWAGATSASAHRLDELLQAARIGIAGDRVDLELDLTPGIAVADRAIAEIDADRDGSFSDDEQRSYVRSVVASLDLAVDGRPLVLTPTSFTFPDPDALRSGDGIILIKAASPSAAGAGAHRLFFNNRYRRDASVYLANALVPADGRIAVTAQLRDAPQCELTIEYRVDGGSTGTMALWSIPAATGLLIVFARAITVRASMSR